MRKHPLWAVMQERRGWALRGELGSNAGADMNKKISFIDPADRGRYHSSGLFATHNIPRTAPDRPTLLLRNTVSNVAPFVSPEGGAGQAVSLPV